MIWKWVVALYAVNIWMIEHPMTTLTASCVDAEPGIKLTKALQQLSVLNRPQTLNLCEFLWIHLGQWKVTREDVREALRGFRFQMTFHAIALHRLIERVIGRLGGDENLIKCVVLNRE